MVLNFGPRKFLKSRYGPLLKKVGRPFPRLCTDIILEQAFMKQHEEVVFKLGESKENLIIAQPHCAVAASRVHTQTLFCNLDVNP